MKLIIALALFLFPTISWALNPVWLPNLVAPATGTQTDDKLGLDVYVTGGTFSIGTSVVAAIDKARIAYSGTNVTTAAYVQLVASLAGATDEIEIFDSSGQTLVLATGAAASEVDKFYITPGGNGRMTFHIASGTRVSVKAVSATANSGELTVNFYK